MLFTSLSYLFFFPAVFVLYWLSPVSWRRGLLLLASYLFYMCWIPTYGVLLLVITAINYFLGLLIDSHRDKGKAILTLGLIINIGILSYFKYTTMFLDTVRSLLTASMPYFHWPVTAVDVPVANVILPLGISFFAFEFIHYIVDIYRGDKPIKEPIDFALFAAFFPSQIAGPIKRYQDFEKQLSHLKPLDPELVHKGLCLILQGLFKKAALSDNLSPIVSAGFTHAHTLSTPDAWLAAFGFTILVYLDFSGYTDLGRGSAMLLGFKLPDNFDLPYFAPSLVQFWRRWHISLSFWLRDYIYISLGGNRVGRFRKNLNLFITMTIGGLWHGAAWHYVVFGMMHGTMVPINQEYDDLIKKSPMLQRFHKTTLSKVLGMILTVFCVNFALVIFRAATVGDAFAMWSRMFIPHTGTAESLFTMMDASTVPAATLAYVLYFILSNGEKLPGIRNIGPYLASRATLARVCGWPTRIALYAGCFFAAVGFSPTSASPFIYFQF